MPTANEIKEKLEKNWIQFVNANSSKLSSKTFTGATPPSVFVGRHGYPKVKVGPMVPPFHGDTTVLDRPEIWVGKSIEEIVNFRLSLVRGISDIDARTTSGKYLESLQELAMASKSVESEATFEKKPTVQIEPEKNIGLDIESAPFIEAMRQFQFHVGHENFTLAHVSLVPIVGPVGEQKTKPTQATVRELRALGLSPDLVNFYNLFIM